MRPIAAQGGGGDASNRILRDFASELYQRCRGGDSAGAGGGREVMYERSRDIEDRRGVLQSTDDGGSVPLSQPLLSQGSTYCSTLECIPAPQPQPQTQTQTQQLIEKESIIGLRLSIP